MFKRILSLTIVFICIFSTVVFSGCSAENFSIYFGIDEMPKNIDPQKAQNHAELLAVRNCFKGLYMQDADGNAVPELAESHTVSDDSLVYTFKLKDAEWKDETPVTADDFVFALERASDPVTASPSAHLLTNIVGVPERLSGESDVTLGVSAVDEKTLEIRLIKPDKNLLSSLTLAVFMPCNRLFFENCGGKYGLDRKNILTNGNYYPSQWTENRHLKLTLSGEPDSKSPVAENVYLTVSSVGKNNIQRIKDKEIGMTADGVNDHTGINTEEFTVKTLYQKNYVLVFNRNSEVGGNELLTDAFARAIHSELYKIKMSERFKAAKSVLPENCTVLNGTLGDINVPEYTFDFDSQKAREDFLAAVSQLKNKKLPEISVLTVDNADVKSVLTEIVSQWQSNLGAYVNITTVPTEQGLLDRVAADEYTVALVPLSGNAKDILMNFADEPHGMYLGSEEFDAAVKTLNETDDRDTAIAMIEKCVEILSQKSSVIPVVSVPTAYIYDKTYQNVSFSALDGTVDFSIIYK